MLHFPSSQPRVSRFALLCVSMGTHLLFNDKSSISQPSLCSEIVQGAFKSPDVQAAGSQTDHIRILGICCCFFQLPDNSIMQPSLRTRDPAGDWSSPGKTQPSVADGAGLRWGQKTLYFYHDPRWCWCCWFRGQTLRPTVGFSADLMLGRLYSIVESISRQKQSHETVP